MANVLIRPSWQLPEKIVTPENVFHNRRHFLRQLGFVGAGLVTVPWSGHAEAGKAKVSGYPYPRGAGFNPGWRLTNETVAGSYNNFYEFSRGKRGIAELAARFVTTPWPITITGLVDKPMTLDVSELIDTMALEERVYRLRCVEAWAMIVPWTGFPLHKLIEKVSPKPEAKFIRFETFNRPEQAPGMSAPDFPWPYFEGLRLEEARHPLTFVATGIYGKPLPKQHGAPVRLVVPWKYGYKSIKSIVKIEFVREQPKTFWETLGPDEYPFESNVDPRVPHPRWSQATERLIDTGDRVRTQPYNGYGSQVAQLYGKP